MPDTSFVDLDNARVEEQRRVMQDIIDNNECPFCMEHLEKYHTTGNLKEGTYWVVTPNQWPYENTQAHLLAIHKTHIENVTELSPEAGAELVTLIAELIRENNYPGGGWTMRFGDTNYSAGTVNHLHAHLIIPDIDAPDFKPVRFKIGKDKEKRG